MVLSMVWNEKCFYHVCLMTFSPYTIKTVGDLEKQLGISLEQGCSSEQAEKKLAANGPNEVEEKQVSTAKIFFRQFQSVFMYLLLAAALLTFVLNEYIDTAFIILFVMINGVLGFRQEYHAEKTTALLRRYFSFKSKVIRDGREIVIDSTNIVSGDVLLLEAGDRIPADMRFVVASSLRVDESPLTGESVPVVKNALTLEREVGDIYRALNIGFAGTTLVSGSAKGVVIATGKDRVMEGISRVEEAKGHQGNFERGLNRFSRFVIYLVFITLAIVFCANYFLKAEFSILDFTIFAVALAISVVPEALPLVITFSLSRGAARLVRRHVVVKRLPAVEELGSIDVLASDKTGTLTENKLAVSSIHTDRPDEFLILANLCSSVEADSLESSDNSFDRALWKALSPRERDQLTHWKRIAEIPFDPSRKRNSVIVVDGTDSKLLVMGAPETILESSVLSDAKKKELEAWVTSEGEKGHRTIALGIRRDFKNESYKPTDEERELEYFGLVSFVDPVKPSTFEAVAHAKRLGVALKIITGDSREVAGAVAVEIGLSTDPRRVITGEEFRRMNESERAAAVTDTHVFARVAPEEKKLIVLKLKEKHDVAFLGEAMNDVLALRVADVSIVVESASDIARSAADIILLKRDLSVIVNGIKEGREVFTNTVKYLKATLLSNLGNFYAVAVASVIMDTLPLLPVQILLLNLLSDFPMMAIATDTVDSKELHKPKQYDTREIMTVALLLGIVSTIFDFIFFFAFLRFSPEVLRTNWFVGSILTELVLIFSIRTRGFFLKAKSPSSPLLFLSVLAMIVTVLLPFIPKLAPLIGLVPPTGFHVVLILSIVSAYFIVTESIKLLIYRHSDRLSALVGVGEVK
jgi:Mg2+-importing ATPase